MARQQGLSGCINAGPQGQLGPQRFDFGIALEHFKAGVEQRHPVKQGLQLGGLVDHMHRRGDLAAVMQQAGNFELVAVPVVHGEVGQRARRGLRHGVGQHQGQLGHPGAMTAGVLGFFLNGDVDQADQRLKQHLQLAHQQPVVQGDRSLRGQRFHQALVGQ